jgi:hypothetical protein
MPLKRCGKQTMVSDAYLEKLISLVFRWAKMRRNGSGTGRSVVLSSETPQNAVYAKPNKRTGDIVTRF